MARPEGEYKYKGVKVTVWKNDFDGKPIFNTQVSKTYKDKNGEYKETSQFSLNECLVLAKLLEKAFIDFGIKEKESE